MALLQQPSFTNFLKLNAAYADHEFSALIDANSGDREELNELGATLFHLQPNTNWYKATLQKCLDADTDAQKKKTALADNELDEILKSLAMSSDHEQPSAKKTSSNKKKPASKKKGPAQHIATKPEPSANQSEAEVPVPSSLDQAIKNAVLSHKQSQRLEGDIAKHIKSVVTSQLTGFAEVLGMNEIIRDANRVVTEFDIVLKEAIVECTLMRHGKTQQIKQRVLNVNNVNPMKRSVVLYAPNYHDHLLPQIEELARQPNAAPLYIAKSKEQLDAILRRLDEESFAKAAQQAGFVQ